MFCVNLKSIQKKGNTREAYEIYMPTEAQDAMVGISVACLEAPGLKSRPALQPS